MHYTIEALVQGSAEIPHLYKRAGEKWAEFFKTHEKASTAEWSKWISAQQIGFFEQHCGGRLLGQEVMAWSGFGSLYSTATGFDDKAPLARKLAEAFEKSSVSLEVKSHAEEAAASYGAKDA